jgi:uncharacterized membrane protein YhaH (DUF805 family)
MRAVDPWVAVPAGPKEERMSFTESVRTCLQKYATFDGRASRSEFWWFYLFIVIVSFVLVMPGYLLMLIGGVATDRGDTPGPVFWLGVILLVVGALASLAFLVPQLSVGCRRLHDRGMSGWLQLLLFVPCGNIALIVLWALEGTPGDNAYGPRT